ncbi:MAG: hypothetical protein U0353_29640 [Sandaracinus sp.]
MRKRQVQRVVGQIVLAAMPTLALTTACRTTGETTYVVRSAGRACRDACAQELGGQGAPGDWRVGEVMDCVDATSVEGPGELETSTTPSPDRAPAPTVPVAVCRMRTHYTGGIGRRPEGLVLAEAEGTSEAGAFFARIEQLERAAVHAFARTERALRDHRAPSHLVRDVIRARREEERHVVIAARWRAVLGGLPATLAVPDLHTPSLAALARENASEGCVHEAWGAILAAAHARGALDGAHVSLARDLAEIAADEASHAALSVRLDRWARAHLSSAARTSLSRARQGAIEEIRASLEDDEPALHAIGWPDRTTRRRLFDEASRRLAWRHAA